MKIAVVTGTVTATAKDDALIGGKLLLTNIVDSDDSIQEHAVVAFDTVGAGVGDKVLLTQGSAARLANGASSLPVDVCIVAVIDDIALAPRSRVKRISKAGSTNQTTKRLR